MSNKHKNYEILNLIGYGLAKFDKAFIKEFGYDTKVDLYKYFVNLKIAETNNVIKNRMDLFAPFFNSKKGWYQKGNAYIGRKQLIESLYEEEKEDVSKYADIVKLFNKNFKPKKTLKDIKPIVESKFKKLQKTGLKAELYFMKNFNKIPEFKNAVLEDARLYGDGYDFQLSIGSNSFLVEVKGIKDKKGRFRFTQNEYKKAKKYKDNYFVAVVLNLNDLPRFVIIKNPAENLKFEEVPVQQKQIIEYRSMENIC